MNRALIFDLDGVIVQTAGFHYLAWSKIAGKLGFELTVDQNEELKGISRDDSLAKILRWAGAEISTSEFARLTDQKNRDYLSRVEKMTSADILPGVLDFIQNARKEDFLTAVGSASKNTPVILDKTGLTSLFDVVVDGNSVHRAKPNPEVFTTAAVRLDVLPARCIVFEDSAAGIEAANTAGMISIGLGDENILRNADVVFPDFTKITVEFIKQIKK